MRSATSSAVKRRSARLRVKDLYFERQRLVVCAGKGKKDRATMLPPSLHAPLRRQFRKVRIWHAEDREAASARFICPLR